MIIAAVILLNGQPILEREIRPLDSRRHRIPGRDSPTQERLLVQILRNRLFTWRNPEGFLSVRLEPSDKSLKNLKEILKAEGDTLILSLQASFEKIEPNKKSRLLENGWKRVV
jgi:hypothetical protein